MSLFSMNSKEDNIFLGLEGTLDTIKFRHSILLKHTKLIEPKLKALDYDCFYTGDILKKDVNEGKWGWCSEQRVEGIH